MAKVRAAITVGLVGALVLLGGGVANASPPGFDPLGGLPLPVADFLRAVLAPVVQLAVDAWNFFGALLS